MKVYSPKQECLDGIVLPKLLLRILSSQSGMAEALQNSVRDGCVYGTFWVAPPTQRKVC